MSSRQLRKLQRQRDLEKAKLQGEEEVSEEEPVASLPSKSKASLFANLAALQDDVEDEDEGEKEAAESLQQLSKPDPTPTIAPKSKKAKAKKKKKANNTSKEKPAEEEYHRDGADEIDAALRELNIKKPSGAYSAASAKPAFDPQYERVCALLGINTQHLKVANEMRNLFGRTAVENHDDSGGPVGRGARGRQRGQHQQVDLETALKGHHAPGKGLSELTLRRNCFVQGKDDWPRGTTGGLTMAMVDDQREVDGTIEFRYVHDQAYQTLQQIFQTLVDMGDPQALIELLTRNPYHISLLVQVSKIAKDQTDHALSSDLLERALFNFGRASSSLFNTKVSQGKARLDFARPENRELWLAGYQYIKSLMMKGTYRTALEWAKLLLSLAPEEDPYCMRLMIHHLAIRAQEFKWLLDVADSNINQIWKNSEEKENRATIHTTPSLAFAALQLREGANCRKLLADSMQKAPWLFFRLFKELDLDAPPSIWGIEPRTDAEMLFTEIYVLQTKDLWNTPAATSLLMEIAHTISKVDIASIPTVDNSEMTLDVVRFVYLDNTPGLMALAPSHLLHQSNNSEADPLPPDKSIFSYSSQRIAQEEGADPSSGLDLFYDPIAAFVRLLPGFRTTAMESDEDEIDEGTDSGEEGEDQLPPGLGTRLMDMIFRLGPRGDDDDEDENREWTDTDEDMPGLAAQSDDEMPELEEESDDEMPNLVQL